MSVFTTLCKRDWGQIIPNHIFAYDNCIPEILLLSTLGNDNPVCHEQWDPQHGRTVVLVYLCHHRGPPFAGAFEYSYLRAMATEMLACAKIVKSGGCTPTHP